MPVLSGFSISRDVKSAHHCEGWTAWLVQVAPATKFLVWSEDQLRVPFLSYYVDYFLEVRVAGNAPNPDLSSLLFKSARSCPTEPS